MEYYGHVFLDERLYIFIELCKGGDLRDFIRKNAKKTFNELDPNKINAESGFQLLYELKVVLLFEQLLEGMVFLNKHSTIFVFM